MDDLDRPQLSSNEVVIKRNPDDTVSVWQMSDIVAIVGKAPLANLKALESMLNKL